MRGEDSPLGIASCDAGGNIEKTSTDRPTRPHSSKRFETSLTHPPIAEQKIKAVSLGLFGSILPRL